MEILCGKDSEMMHEFSRRSLQHLHVSALMSAVLPFFSAYIEANVRKEVDKDGLIIRESAAAFTAGRPACDLDLEDIFEKTKAIDRTFLDNLAIPAFALSVRYSDFADIRIRRIWRIARTVYQLLAEWPDTASFSDAVRRAFSNDGFRKVLLEILHLYNLETRMLGDSIRSPFHKAIAGYSESLFQAMESVREELAADCTRAIYGERGHA